MKEIIPPFDPEIEIALLAEEFPSSASEANVAGLISTFFTYYERGSATEDQLLRYIKALSEKYPLPEKRYLSILQKVRDFDFNRNPALVVDEADRYIWHGRFSTLALRGLLSEAELRRVASQPWWGELSDFIADWYLSEIEVKDEDEDL